MVHYIGYSFNHLSSAFGQEKNVSLNNLSVEDVSRALENVLSGKAWIVSTEDCEQEHQNLGSTRLDTVWGNVFFGSL